VWGCLVCLWAAEQVINCVCVVVLGGGAFFFFFFFFFLRSAERCPSARREVERQAFLTSILDGMSRHLKASVALTVENWDP